MKIRRTLSGLLFALGCAVCFIGVMALILPNIDNRQLQLVLASFQAPSSSAIVTIVNRMMSFSMANSWQVIGLGVLCVLIGGGLMVKWGEETAPKQEAPEAVFKRPDPQPDEQPSAPASAAYAVTEAKAEPLFSEEVPEIHSSVLSYHTPLLEENRIDETRPHLPSSFASESLAIRTEVGDYSPSGTRAILRTPPPVAVAPEPVIQQQPTPPPVLIPEEKPVTRQAEQTPSRIRSTMGQHRQW